MKQNAALYIRYKMRDIMPGFVRTLVAAFLALSLWSCEDVIELDLNDETGKVVIEAQLSNLELRQRIRVSRTVPFDSDKRSEAVTNATVSVRDGRGDNHVFTYDTDGVYLSRGFRPKADNLYSLEVTVDGELFSAQSYMPAYIDVDSVGIVRETLFSDDYYIPTFKFTDPAGVPNYYKYNIAINGGPMRFAMARDDKFNDGLQVSHQATDDDHDLVVGDSVTVVRYIIDEPVYRYWNQIAMNNPGNAAPGNPTSNIRNAKGDALGYFSVASAMIYKFEVRDEEREREKAQRGK